MEISDAIRRFVDPSGDDKKHSTALQEVLEYTNQEADKLMLLIVELESSLTAVKDKERNRASLLVAHLLQSQLKPLTASHIHHFCVFFNSRLADYPSVVPSLIALKALIANQSQHFQHKYCDIPDILVCLFKELDVQSLPQTMRFRVFDLLKTILEYLRGCSDVKSVLTASRLHGPDICTKTVINIISAVFGEKDPRCLLQCFEAVSIMCEVFHEEISSSNISCTHSTQAQSIAERIFDSLSCYFPITFQPPPDDPFNITSEMLVSALSQALTKHESVIQHTAPYLLDQIVNPTESVSRLHAVMMMEDICLQHGIAPAVHNLLGELGDHLFDMICTNSPAALDSVERELHSTSKRLMQTLCRSVATSTENWQLFAVPVIQRACEAIQKDERSLDSANTKRAVDVMCIIGSSSFACAQAVHTVLLPVIVPPCIDMFSHPHPHFVAIANSLSLLTSLIGCTPVVDYAVSPSASPLSGNTHAELLWKTLCEHIVSRCQLRCSDSASSTNDTDSMWNIQVKSGAAVYVELLSCLKELSMRIDAALLVECSGAVRQVTANALNSASVYCCDGAWHASVKFLSGLASCGLGCLDAVYKENCSDVLISSSESVQGLEDCRSLFLTIGSLVKGAFDCEDGTVYSGTHTLMNALMGYVVPSADDMMGTKHVAALEALSSVLSSDVDEKSGDLSTNRSAQLIAQWFVDYSGYNGRDAIIVLAETAFDGSLHKRTNVDVVDLVCAVIRKIMGALNMDGKMATSSASEVLHLCANKIASSKTDRNLHRSVIHLLVSTVVYVHASDTIWKLSDSVSATAWVSVLEVAQKSILSLDEPTIFKQDCIWLHAMFINKAEPGPALEARVLNVFEIALPNLLKDSAEWKYSVDLVVWVTRGLVMRGDILISSLNVVQSLFQTHSIPQFVGNNWQAAFLSLLCELLDASIGRDELSIFTSEQFSVVCAENLLPCIDGKISSFAPFCVLVSRSTVHCTLLWRQKLWSRLYSELSRRLSLSGHQLPLLSCICCLASEMPAQVVENDLADITRYSVQAMMLSSAMSGHGHTTVLADRRTGFILKQRALACLLPALSGPLTVEAINDEKCVSQPILSHIHSLVPLLLQIAQQESTSLPGSAAVRALALRCLWKLHALPHRVLHPMRDMVIKGLAVVLNDNKRAVRKLAAKVRNVWIV